MSRPKGEASSQKTTKDAAKGSARAKKASSQKATAAARSGRAQAGTPTAAANAPVAPVPAAPRPALLDVDARRQIAGVIVAVVGASLLVSLLVPSTGVVSSALNAFLHTLFGMGAVLVPIALLAWSITIFTERVGVVAGRVIVGLLMVAVAVMCALGLTAPGAASDPTSLFVLETLRSRGGYVGNGLAWMLISLFGQVAGLFVAAGLGVAGIIVIGLDIKGALGQVRARHQQARARSLERRQSRERANAMRRQDAYEYEDELPQDYQPTVLFDPQANRRASSRGAADMRLPIEEPARATTTVIPFDQEPTQFDSFAVPPASVLSRAGMSVTAQTTLLDEEFEDAPATEVREECVRDAVASEWPNTQAQTQPQVRPQTQESSCDGFPVPPKSVLKRAPRSVSSGWYNPADEWNRDNFDPNDLGSGRADELVPGVIPGAPLYYDDEIEAAADSYVADASPAEASSSRIVEDCDLRAESARACAPVPSPSSSYALGDYGFADDGQPASSVAPVMGAPAAAMPGAVPVVTPARTPAGTASKRTVKAVATQEPLQSRPGEVVTSAVELPWEEPDNSARLGVSDVQPVTATPARAESSLPARKPAQATIALESFAAPASQAPAHAEGGAYVLPSPSFVQRSGNGNGFVSKKTDGAAKTAAELQSALNEFHVEAEVIDWVEGPTCTTYQVRPGEGVRVSKFTSLEDDIARTLARTSVRIYAPVPGTSYVGIEVSNNVRQNVAFGDVLPCVTGGPLDFAVGLDANGKPVHSDLAKLPHLLIAGTTGSGKSVTVNSIVLSFLMRDTPDDLRLIIVDPKQVEFSEYNGIPHLVMPVVTDPRQAAAALQWGVTEMDRRYRIFSNLGVRDLKAYNNLVANANFDESQTTLTHLPCIVVVIDELADLMMVAKKDVEASIVRIAQLGRAAGIHLIIATQTPRAEIVTGLIRANVANRIALRVSKGTDSRIIIDQGGAEKLLPHGDMLFLEAAYGDRPRRIQGCNITDEEKSRILTHLKSQPVSARECSMAPLPGTSTQLQLDTSVDVDADKKPSGGANDDDPLAWEAAKLVVENQLGSTSMIQRRMKLGYARAGRVMDLLEEMGVVGPARGSKPRDVLVADLDELQTLRQADSTTGE